MTKINKKHVEIITDEQTSGSVLLLLLTDLFSIKPEMLQDFMSWDPQTIKMEIKDTFGIDMPEANFNKFMAARELVTSNAFWKSLPDFIDLCNALDDGSFDPRVFDIAAVGEIAWAITESVLLWPPDKSSSEEFAPDILAYIREVAAAEGLTRIPSILKFAIPEDDKIWDQITAQFSDDPVMFNSIYQLSIAKTELMDNMILERLDYMIQQMKSITDVFSEESIKLVQTVRDLIEKHRVQT